MKLRIWLLCGAVAAALSPPLRQGARTTRRQAQNAESPPPRANKDDTQRRAPKKQDDPRRRKTPELFDEVKGPGIHLKKKTRSDGPRRRLAPAQSSRT